jgi:hypothetical protein
VTKEENYVPGFIGLRRLYDKGQYYTVTSIEQNRYDVRVHHADGSIARLFGRVDEERKTELVRAFAGGSLPEGGQS